MNSANNEKANIIKSAGVCMSVFLNSFTNVTPEESCLNYGCLGFPIT